jgi:hypothetical protein
MANHFLTLRRLALAVCVFSAFSTLCSASVEIGAADSGWYRSDGRHFSTNLNYLTQVNGTPNFRNFFVFDLSAVTNTILSASLRLENPAATTNGASSTYTLYDVSTSPATLTADQSGATGVGIYGDLGSGVSYGSVALGSSVGTGFVDIPLNSAALTALNATSSIFAVGGAISTVGSSQVRLFADTGGDFVRKLILEVEQTQTPPTTGAVPEPASVLVWCGIGLLTCLGAFRQRA